MSVREKIFWIEGVKEGQKLEQERIIKLLEPYTECQDDNYCITHCDCQRSDYFIALIKGEQK